MRIATVPILTTLAAMMLGCVILAAQAVAAPPTATVSPGYDRALLGSREAAGQTQPQSAQPPRAVRSTPAPRTHKPKPHG
jgi:hypothetical protein